jgi:hypothetical protein
MQRSSLASAAVLGLCIGGGVALAGIYHGLALKESRKPLRVVSVRGLAEREVEADLAVWPITFVEAGNDLAALNARLTEKRRIIAEFLAASGFGAADLSHATPSVSDQHAREYGEGRSRPEFRYLGKATVTLRSGDVRLVKKAMEQSGSLVGKGIVVLAEDWNSRTQYFFKGLNAVKPAMIEEATRNARAAAEKFAADSGSRLGKIKSASQGLFEITDLDQSTPERKQVRVVTSVEFFLADE